MKAVAIGLIERAGRLLICRRREDQTHAGKWEFPGGKVEAGELPASALERELREELGIRRVRAEEWARYDYAYPGKPPLTLVFFRVTGYDGRIDTSQFAAHRWERAENLPQFDFLPGDARIVRELASAGRTGAAAASGAEPG